jgi:heme-degrading monooxygenase HmoA
MTDDNECRDGVTGSTTSEAPKPEFVAMSRFVIANGMEHEVKAAFRGRPGLVDHASGFLRMDVLSPLDAPGEIWIMTYWTDADSYRL